MGHNELRKDYLLDRWVVIATERARRPTDFAKQREKQPSSTATCPMCPGNEHMTPAAVLVYLKSGKGIRKTHDTEKSRHKNWLVRCIPNLYPAFSPPKEKLSQKQIMKTDDLAMAIGHHEVIVETPNHEEHPANAKIPQLTLVMNAYIDRLRTLSRKPYVKYVSVFRNHGREAGASLSHPHSQIIATPFLPKTIKEEMETCKKHWKQHKQCIFCEILRKELDGPRLIYENKKFAAFTPYASINPMEFWIMPKQHQGTLLDMAENETKIFAQTLHTCLKALSDLVNDPPYNYGFHIAMSRDTCKHYHWQLEVYPTLAIWAGFEKSTGIYINTIPPETAAESLRKAISP